MLSIGIESTAHTLGIGIVEESKGEFKVLADQRSVFRPELGKGIHPMLAAGFHESKKENVLQAALKEASMSLDKANIISYAAGPGLPPCLKAGYELASSLARQHAKPLVRVNHAAAHYEIAKHLTDMKSPVFLYVSGGNTQVIAAENNKFYVFGETQDISVGNCLDAFAREAGLPFPGGPEVEKLASQSNKFIELPYSVKGMDVSFSGILTAALNELENNRLEDICFSLQETSFAMLTEVCERAMAQLSSSELMTSGGVAASARLSEMLGIMCRERGAKFANCPKEYSGDNGVMIALAGIKGHAEGRNPQFDFNPKWRIDETLL